MDYATQLINEHLSVKVEALADGRVKLDDYLYVTGEVHGLKMAVSILKDVESAEDQDGFDD